MSHIKFFLIFSFAIGILTVHAQHFSSNFWLETAYLSRNNNIERQIIPNQHQTFKLNLDQFKQKLVDSPKRFSNTVRNLRPIISFPDTNGRFSDYAIVKNSVMHDRLSKKYPEIQSYIGFCINNPLKTIRFDVTVHGFHGMILEPGKKNIYIDPYAKGETSFYILYKKNDLPAKTLFNCELDEINKKQNIIENTNLRAGDCNLKTFKLALACTGEYAQFHGGTKPSVLSAMNTTMTRVNGIYERDLGIRMIIIANNDDIIYLNSSTDPYTNNNSTQLINENQTTCDNEIGSSNYDIGHVLSTGGGGLASIRSVCRSNKAKAVTGSTQPVGDPFDIDYVCHEMGHQFGAYHTFNNSCSNNRTSSSAVEPGSGSTIMGYAGICPPNIQNHSDAYFHGKNIEHIQSYMAVSSCFVETTTGNTSPVITTLNDYTIPNSTPFELEAIASDIDGDILSYDWEQMDTEIASMPPSSSSTNGPIFRSLSPSISPIRSFPKLSSILANTTTTWEVLPTVSRTLKFRCSVRDNHSGGGCTTEDNMVITVSDNSTPFEVTKPNTNIIWSGAETKEITWNVANTDISPINTSTVDIFLSIDGGLTFPITIVTEEINDGSAMISVPNDIESTQCRIKIKGGNNIFFDISNQDFTIEVPQIATFEISSSNLSQTVCADTQSVSYPIDLSILLGFDETVNLTLTGLPNGANYSFSPNNFIPPTTSTLTIEQLSQIVPGTYPLVVNAQSSSINKSISLSLTIHSNQLAQVSLISPSTGTNNLVQTTLSWNELSYAIDYIIEISTNPSFPFNNTTLFTKDQTSINISNLIPSTAYFWRVKGNTPCISGNFSSIWSFHTAGVFCDTYSNQQEVILPLTASTTNSIISILDSKLIYDINVSIDISHSWSGDLIGNLVGPDDISIALWDRPGIPASEYGCNQDDIHVTFDDEATNTASMFESTCNSNELYAISGKFQPIGTFLNLNNKLSQGIWQLEIIDPVDEDGGTINSWDLEVCYLEAIQSSILLVNNQTLIIGNNQTKTIVPVNLKTTSNGIIASDLSYMLLVGPSFGDIKINNTILSIGTQFTQEDIDLGKLTYINTTTSTSDNFIFDVSDNNGGWISNQIFNIEVSENNLSATATVLSKLKCTGDTNGSIILGTTGGTTPYTYSIDGINFQSSNTFADLSAGNYNFTIKDINDFTTTTSLNLLEPSALVINTNLTDNILEISGLGGTSPYNYSIDGSNYQSSNIFNLSNGQYTVFIKDSNDCINSESVLVSINSIVLDFTTTPITCYNESDGQIIISATGGFEPYQFSIDNGVNYQSSNTFNGLSAGVFKVIVKDENDFLKQTNNITLVNPTEIDINIEVNENTVTINSSGINTYSVDNGAFQSSNIFTNLSNGSHTAKVKNNLGCQKSISFSINIIGLTLSYSKNDLSCFGQATGEITAIAEGGIGQLSYSINNQTPQSSPNFNGLIEGTYILKVIDESSNSEEVTVQLTAPPELIIETTVEGNTVTLMASGGTPDYSYQITGFNTFQSTPIISNIPVGAYIAKIKDSNGCTKEASIEIFAPFSVSVETTNISCSGETDGKITIKPSGGMMPYSYSLNNGTFVNSPIFDNLPAGDYHIAVKDESGVEFTVNLTLTEPAIINLIVSSEYNTLVIDNSENIFNMFSLNGINWQASNKFLNLSVSTYTIYAQQSNNCVTTQEYFHDYSVLGGSAVQVLSCKSVAGIEITAMGGLGPYHYSIDNENFQSSQIFKNIENSGKVNFYIKDVLGHSFHGQITVSGTPVLELDVSFEGNSIELLATGGTLPYIYSIDSINFQTSNIFTELTPNYYTAIVKDQNDCIDTYEVTIVSIDEVNKMSDISIIPNPTKGQFTILLNEETQTSISIKVFNLMGQIVFENAYQKHQTDFKTSVNLKNNGVYQIVISDGEKIGIKRVLVVK